MQDRLLFPFSGLYVFRVSEKDAYHLSIATDRLRTAFD